MCFWPELSYMVTLMCKGDGELGDLVFQHLGQMAALRQKWVVIGVESTTVDQGQTSKQYKENNSADLVLLHFILLHFLQSEDCWQPCLQQVY